MERLPVAPYRPAGASVLSLHDVESSLLRELPVPAALRQRAERRWNRWAMAQFERTAASASGVTTVVPSDHDRRELGVPSEVVPNGTDVPIAVTPVPLHGRLLFVGSMHYAPNVLAMQWWVECLRPRLAPYMPRLSVVGRAASQALHDLTEHLDIIGEVTDVGSYLESASVVVVPLQHGSGTRLKILEAMAHGRPVVTTAKGAEGLGLVNGRDAAIVDDPQEFAAMVDRVFTDPELAARLAAGGRRVAELYSWEDLGERFADVLVSASHRAPGMSEGARA